MFCEKLILIFSNLDRQLALISSNSFKVNDEGQNFIDHFNVAAPDKLFQFASCSTMLCKSKITLEAVTTEYELVIANSQPC